MKDLEEEIRQLAVEAGVKDKDARDLAHEFGRRIRDLTAPEPSPDVLIRENGSSYHILLRSKNKALAKQYLEEQGPRTDYKLSSVQEEEEYVHYVFTEGKEEPPVGDSISEIFNNLPHEKQKDVLESLEEMSGEA